MTPIGWGISVGLIFVITGLLAALAYYKEKFEEASKDAHHYRTHRDNLFVENNRLNSEIHHLRLDLGRIKTQLNKEGSMPALANWSQISGMFNLGKLNKEGLAKYEIVRCSDGRILSGECFKTLPAAEARISELCTAHPGEAFALMELGKVFKGVIPVEEVKL